MSKKAFARVAAAALVLGVPLVATGPAGASPPPKEAAPTVVPTAVNALPSALVGPPLVPGFEQFELPPNDDSSTGLVKLPFAVTFYGKTYTGIYINNNGNVTFRSALGQYTPTKLSAQTAPMIAPFWADVDTRGGNTLKYGTGTIDGHKAFGVAWPAVGCYAEIDGVTNTFQLLLIQRPDTGKGNFDIEFNYGPIEWESGQASGGDGSCLGGVPPAAGYTNGAGAVHELPGSGVTGGFLSSNPTTGLSNQQYNSGVPGVDVFPVRSGQPALGAAGEYVALGDSYASGEGSFTYASPAAPCYRSTSGYAQQIAETVPIGLSFAACAGATVRTMVEGTAAEIKKVTSNTHLMTLSVGGDSVGFSHVLASCVGGLVVKGGKGCAQRDEAAAQTALSWLESGRPPGTYTLPGIQSALSAAAPTEKNAITLPSLTQLYEQLVARAAPGAELLVVGYPDLFETAVTPVVDCQVGTVYGVDKLTVTASDVEWLNERADQLDQIIQSQAATAAANTGANIRFVDPRPGFIGGDLCDESGHEYIVPLEFEYPSGKPRLKPESFHPTQEGQEILASQLLGELP